MKARVAGIAGSVLALTVIGGFAAASTFQSAPVRPWLCASEGVDFGPCVWDAQAQGNRQGQSFFLDAKGNVTLLPQK
jgi:hypothetical protein